jgi:predicted esterase
MTAGAVIFLHGSGDTGKGVQTWLQQIAPAFFSQVEWLTGQLDNVG